MHQTQHQNLFLLTLKFHFLQLLCLAAGAIVLWGENHVLFGSPLAVGWELIWTPGLVIMMAATVSTWFWYYIAVPNIKESRVA